MRRIKFILCLLVLCMLPCICTWADTVLPFCINEICSGNGGLYTVNGTAPDYIELHNLTGKSVSLDGYFLSDDEDHLQKFSLDGYKIPSGGYLVLLADKKELPFKLSSSGEDLYLSDSNGLVLQHVTLPEIEKDSTYSLQADGIWHVTEPTPMKANLAGVPYVKKVYVASPRFSHEAGFYDEPFELILEGYRTYKLYYTTDGSIPDENSTLYTGPIRIEDATSNPNTLSMRTDILIGTVTPPSKLVKKATIIRAVAIDPDGNRSNEVTKTYFVGFQNYENYQDIPVLSIVADPYDLFDEQEGIYVLGKTYLQWLGDKNRDKSLSAQKIPTNYRQHGREWEIPADIQWFDEENNLCLSQGIGIRIHGNWSRENAKKSLKLFARKEYGASTFQYDILEGTQSKEKLILRTNLGKDSVIHALLAETGIQTSPFTPCLTFINGEFWGLYEIREKQGEEDIADFYGLNPDDLLVIEGSELVAGTTPDDVKDKSERGVYRDLRTKVSNIDASTAQGYAEINRLIDIDNYTTYIAALAYLNNRDYNSNFTLWRTAEKTDEGYADGRWRWIFQDLDLCCDSDADTTVFISHLPDDEFFSTLWYNNTFKTNFLTRLMDYANVELTPEYVRQFITPLYTYYNPYMYETNIRFSSKNLSKKPGTEELNDMMSFIEKRRDEVIQQITDSLGEYRGTSKLLLKDLVQGISLEINGHQAHIYGTSWEGVYFKGCTVSFTAGDVPGYSFNGWYENGNLITTERTLEVSTDNDRSITPVYDELPVIVIMNETEKIYSSGKYGFTKQLEDSKEECLLLVDETITVRRKYKDNTLTLTLSDDVKEPQGFSINVPLHDLESAGVVLSLSIPDEYSSLNWTLLCGNDETTLRKLNPTFTKLSDGLMLVSFDIPEDVLENQKAFIRVEVSGKKTSIAFTILGYRVYGMAMEPALARAHELIRVLRAIDADERYYPDLEQMENWIPSEIEKQTVYLRNRLQADMMRGTIYTVGGLGLESPVFEGLENYTTVTFGEKLIAAYYNLDAINVRSSVIQNAYIYKIVDNDSLLLVDNQDASDGIISIGKSTGTYIILDRSVEDIRFSIAFESVLLSGDLLDALSNVVPDNALWMNVETFTQYQEEIAVALPSDWTGANVIIYRMLDGNLLYVGDVEVNNGEILITPTSGRFLLSDEPLESFEEQYDWRQQEKTDARRIQSQAKQDWIKLRNVVCITLAVLLGLTLIGSIVFSIYKKKKK